MNGSLRKKAGFPNTPLWEAIAVGLIIALGLSIYFSPRIKGAVFTRLYTIERSVPPYDSGLAGLRPGDQTARGVAGAFLASLIGKDHAAPETFLKADLRNNVVYLDVLKLNTHSFSVHKDFFIKSVAAENETAYITYGYYLSSGKKDDRLYRLILIKEKNVWKVKRFDEPANQSLKGSSRLKSGRYTALLASSCM